MTRNISLLSKSKVSNVSQVINMLYFSELQSLLTLLWSRLLLVFALSCVCVKLVCFEVGAGRGVLSEAR